MTSGTNTYYNDEFGDSEASLKVIYRLFHANHLIASESTDKLHIEDLVRSQLQPSLPARMTSSCTFSVHIIGHGRSNLNEVRD